MERTEVHHGDDGFGGAERVSEIGWEAFGMEKPSLCDRSDHALFQNECRKAVLAVADDAAGPARARTR